MKQYNLFIMALISTTILISACGKTSDCTETSLGEPFEFQELDVICIDDTYELTINKVVDERCPCFANCIWAGEFLFKANISNGTDDQNFLIHEESLVTPAEANIFDLKFLNVTLITKQDCTNPVSLENLTFEMTVEES